MASTEQTTWWAIVWRQFTSRWSNRAAVAAIAGLVAAAIYAPVIASNQPFLWVDSDGVQLPWFRSLLFNRNVFDSGIDLFFNLLLVLSPFVAAHGLWFRRALSRRSWWERDGAWARWFVVWLVLVVVVFIAVMSMSPRTALPDWSQLEAAGAGRAWFAPLRVGYNDVLYGVDPGTHRQLLGIDSAGRDVFVRMLYGTRVSLSVGVIAVGIYLSIGIVLGALAGYFGGAVDAGILRAIEIFLCFPALFLILTFISFLEQPSIVWVMVFIGLVGWTGPARLVRGEFLRLRNADFVAAAKAQGLTNTRIIFRHVLPNALGPVLVNATFGVASAVLVESSLSFLGIGDRSLPSWGRILAVGRAMGDDRMMLIAGVAIFVTVSAFNLAGEGIRDALDPRLRK